MPDAADHATAQLIAGARRHQAARLRELARAHEHMVARDEFITQLRESNPKRWSYAAIAAEVGLTPVNVVKILKRPLR
jgi:hypothetical protein